MKLGSQQELIIVDTFFTNKCFLYFIPIKFKIEVFCAKKSFAKVIGDQEDIINGASRENYQNSSIFLK